jgi:hypothetical protein
MLKLVSCITISIKFCIEHIIRNTLARCDIDKCDGKKLRNVIAELQRASTFEKYLDTCQKLVNSWDVVGKDIAVYIMRIHPRHWTVFGNLDTIADSSWMDKYASMLRTLFLQCEIMSIDKLNKLTNEELFYKNVPIGMKFPLFGICRNNVSESAANTMRLCGIRNAAPPLSIRR